MTEVDAGSRVPSIRCPPAPTWWRSSIGSCVGSPMRRATTAWRRVSTCSHKSRPRRRRRGPRRRTASRPAIEWSPVVTGVARPAAPRRAGSSLHLQREQLQDSDHGSPICTGLDRDPLRERQVARQRLRQPPLRGHAASAIAPADPGAPRAEAPRGRAATTTRARCRPTSLGLRCTSWPSRHSGGGRVRSLCC